VRREGLLVRLPWSIGDERNQNPDHATRYSLGAGEIELAEDPVARAYGSGESQVLAGLPPWSGRGARKADYIRKWSEQGVPRSRVEGFSRHARCVLAIPMRLQPKVVGVLCIDFREPMAPLADALALLCTRVMEASGSFIAALLLLREQ